ncbi:MAG: glycosyltransferase family 2 protein [Magnetococcales bacterium]|nr:glycosyltransferase family 2 protein [Magnetococcales bacterium]NGZ26611.1 glycosyltransferase family 2 protein [Magnetococcales bacterium]
MSPTSPVLLSVVTTAYNEEEVIESFCQQVTAVLAELSDPFEIIVVDNGSHDRTLSLLKAWRAKDERLHYVSLSRNFGHQGGLVAGLEQARGQVVISMDADLQHPPHLIPALLAKWQEGYQVVNTLRQNNEDHSWWRQWVNRHFYRLLSRLSGLQLADGQSDFRLLDRQALNALVQLPEKNKFLRGLAVWIGYTTTSIPYKAQARSLGVSKFRFGHLLRFGMDGIFSFSVLPLRLFAVGGFIIAMVSMLNVLYTVGLWGYATLFHKEMYPSGWPTLTSGIFFLGGVQLMGIGLLGEYLGRIFDEVRSRPAYLIRESSLVERKVDS